MEMNNFTTDQAVNISEFVHKRVYILMIEALQSMVSTKMLKEQKMPTFAFVMADRTTLPEKHKEKEDAFLDVIFDNAEESVKEMVQSNQEIIKNMLPYVVICELPKDTYKRDALLEICLKDTKAHMYALVTEAIGTKRRYLSKENFKPSLSHPDNIQQYLLMSIRRKGKGPVTMAAPITLNIIRRDGTYGRKVGDFKRYKWLQQLPTDYDKNWN